ncbi:MAG: response regulator [Deltaproteobacteria bacterium]|nr:response regulator [Deltaproteobacteria bacterium]
MAKIVVIDDEESIRTLLARILAHANHQVRTAANGKAGFRLLKDESADLVITDILMPEMDGLEVLMELRQLYPDLRFIAISGGGDHRVLTHLITAKRLGAVRTLSKPFEIDDLLHAVDETLSAPAIPPMHSKPVRRYA